MDLKTYIQIGRGNGVALAASLGIPHSYLSQMAGGDRTITPARASAIERMTLGAVTRQAMRPDDWQAIWPELADVKAA